MNIVSYSINRTSPFHERVTQRLAELTNEDDVSISVLTLYETEYGLQSVPAEHRERVHQAKQIMLNFLIPGSLEQLSAASEGS